MRTTVALGALLAALAACGSDVVTDGTGGGGANAATTTAGTGGNATTAGSGGSASVTTGPGGTTSSTTGAGGGGAFGACGLPGTCILALDDCCGPCGRPTLDDFDAINEAQSDAHAAAVCPDPDGTPCPGCASELNPNLFAACGLGQGQCVGLNLPETELAACSVPTDCVLRAGLGCCVPCGDVPTEAWVALRGDATGSLTSLVCVEDAACPECEPTAPVGLAADCVAGVCTVVPL